MISSSLTTILAIPRDDNPSFANNDDGAVAVADAVAADGRFDGRADDDDGVYDGDDDDDYDDGGGGGDAGDRYYCDDGDDDDDGNLAASAYVDVDDRDNSGYEILYDIAVVYLQVFRYRLSVPNVQRLAVA